MTFKHLARTNGKDLRPASMNYITNLSDMIQFSKVVAPIFLLNYVEAHVYDAIQY